MFGLLGVWVRQALHTLLRGKRGREKGLCLRLAVIAECDGECAGYLVACGVVGPQRAVGMGQCTTANRLGFGSLTCIDEQRRDGVGRSKGADVPFATHTLLDGQRVAQHGFCLGKLTLVLQGSCEIASRGQGIFMLGP